jgi:colanic acid/amylovoran biosynthesis glycosyltransferase
MHRSGCQLRYTIVGDGELRLQIEQQISLLGMQDVVTLAGWCNHEQVVEQIHAAHLLIAPSVTASNGDQEGIPNVVKEAMATGLPVLTTRHGGIPELVEDGVNGYLVAEGDAAALEERLQHFVESPDEATALSRHARVKIEAEFDSEKINDALERLYLNLAGARK